MVKLSSSMDLAYLVETNWGGGMAGALKAVTPATTAAELSAMDAGVSAMGGITQYKRKKVRDIGGLSYRPSAIHNEGTKPTVLKLMQFVQTSTFFAYGFQTTPTAAGATPTSLLIYWNNALDAYQTFGCVPATMKFTAEKAKANILESEWIFYKHTKNATITGGPKGFSSATRSTFKDVTVTINTVVYSIEKLEIIATFHYVDKGEIIGLGSYFPEKHVVETIDYQIIITTKDETLADVFDTDIDSEAPVTTHDVAVTIAIDGTDISRTFSNMYVPEDGVDVAEIPEFGAKMYKIVLEPGEAFAIT